MKSTITFQDLKEAMMTEVLIASAVDCKTRKAKDIKFNLHDEKYHVKTVTAGDTDEVVYHHPSDAIAAYNKFVV